MLGRMYRRELMIGLCPIILTIAGCTSRFDDRIHLCIEGIDNQYPEPIEVEYRVLEDDEVVLENLIEIESGGYSSITDDPDEPGRFIVQMRVLGQEWATMDSSAVEADHVAVSGRIESNDVNGAPTLALFRTQHPTACE